MSLGEDDKPSRPVSDQEAREDPGRSLVLQTSNPRAGSPLAVRTLSPCLSSRGPSPAARTTAASSVELLCRNLNPGFCLDLEAGLNFDYEAEN